MVAASLIGAPKTDVDTPALLVDLDVMEANIRRVAETCRAHGVGWRPHTKGQKKLIVGYSDTTVHLHEEIVAVRNGRIEAVWRIAGRGRIK